MTRDEVIREIEEVLRQKIAQPDSTFYPATLKLSARGHLMVAIDGYWYGLQPDGYLGGLSGTPDL